MKRVYFRRPKQVDWLFVDCVDEADARRVRANLMADGYEVS